MKKLLRLVAFLAVLAGIIGSCRNRRSNRVSADAALALVRRRQKVTRRHAFDLGAKLYRAKPRAFARRWKDWREVSVEVEDGQAQSFGGAAVHRR